MTTNSMKRFLVLSAAFLVVSMRISSQTHAENLHKSYSEIVDEPPTEKQIKWVDSLCDRLELDPPKFTKRDYSDFIDEWKDYVK